MTTTQQPATGAALLAEGLDRVAVDTPGSLGALDEGEISAKVIAKQALAASPALAAAIELGLAFERAEKALPEGWIPLSVNPADPDEQPWLTWAASTCSNAFWDGSTNDDSEMATAFGPTPTAALTALAEALEGMK